MTGVQTCALPILCVRDLLRYNVSGLAVESVAAAALYVYLAFALRNTDICAAAGAFEETVALALGEAVFPRSVLVLPAVEISKVRAVFHLAPVELPRESADEGGDQRKDTEPDK